MEKKSKKEKEEPSASLESSIFSDEEKKMRPIIREEINNQMKLGKLDFEKLDDLSKQFFVKGMMRYNLGDFQSSVFYLSFALWVLCIKSDSKKESSSESKERNAKYMQQLIKDAKDKWGDQ